MRKLLSRAASALAGAVVLAACQDATRPMALEEGSAGSGNDTKCVGPMTGTFDNVVVPKGAECMLDNSTVRGNVKALEDSRLFMFNDNVTGNVEGDKASTVQVAFSTVRGNIHIIEGHDLVVVSAVVFNSILPNGNIQVEKGRFPLGDWVVSRNTLQKGNVKVEENRSIFAGFTRFNNVAEDFQVFKNTQNAIFVEFNVIGENLQCKENVAALFSAQGNVVGGNAEGQCAASGSTPESVAASTVTEFSEFPVKKRTH
jgi:hypothetical protein